MDLPREINEDIINRLSWRDKVQTRGVSSEWSNYSVECDDVFIDEAKKISPTIDEMVFNAIDPFFVVLKPVEERPRPIKEGGYTKRVMYTISESMILHPDTLELVTVTMTKTEYFVSSSMGIERLTSYKNDIDVSSRYINSLREGVVEMMTTGTARVMRQDLLRQRRMDPFLRTKVVNERLRKCRVPIDVSYRDYLLMDKKDPVAYQLYYISLAVIRGIVSTDELVEDNMSEIMDVVQSHINSGVW